MPELGKLMVIGGLILAGIGLILWIGKGVSWIGRLPGDIHVERENFSFHFPIVTCVLISIVVSVLMWVFRR